MELPTKTDVATEDFGMQLGKASLGPSIIFSKGLRKPESDIKLEMCRQPSNGNKTVSDLCQLPGVELDF